LSYDQPLSEFAEPTFPMANRIKVHIQCLRCGETFILRGEKDAKGRIDTGFKRCLCSNEDEFDFETLA
jgi:hypothetical protein